jgi:hypothetical protein
MKIKHSKQWYFTAKIITKIAGIIFSFLPAVIATLILFPSLVKNDSDSTISGLFMLGVLLGGIPLLSALVKAFKTPSSMFVITTFLTLLAVIFTCMYFAQESTRYGLMVVSICASSGNIVATALFKLSAVYDELFKHCGEVYVK